MTRKDTIDYEFSFVVTSTREGEFEIGPFEFTSNGESEEVSGTLFRFGKLEPDPDMEIEFQLDRDTMFVGERIPISIRWAFAGNIDEVQYAFSNLQIRSPLFDQFSFQDKPRQTRTTLTLATAKGNVEVDAVVTQEKKDGKEFIVVTGQRTLVADFSGTFEAIPITCRTKKATRWARDLFGGRSARGAVPALSRGNPISLTVKPVPSNGRPESFAGAVGQGFSVDVAANRSVVRVGDPISLTIKIQGDGNLEAISLPDLNEQMGLSPDDFQVSTEQLSGTVSGNTKQFNVSVRVKNQGVTQIPALAYSWFDPVNERFSSTESKPIALQVMETKIVSSSDVVSRSGSNPSETSVDAAVNNEAAKNSVSFAGANLAIETDIQSLTDRTSPHKLTRYAPATIYGAAILFAGFALLRSRRSDETIQRGRKRSQLQQLRRTIQKAGGISDKSAYSTIADALREFIREFEPPDRSSIDKIIADCDTATYAQSDSIDAGTIRELTSQAIAVLNSESTKAYE